MFVPAGLELAALAPAKVVRMLIRPIFLERAAASCPGEKLLCRLHIDAAAQHGVRAFEVSEQYVPRIDALVGQIGRELDHRQPGYLAMAQLKLAELLLLLSRSVTDAGHDAAHRGLTIEGLMVYVEENYSDDFSLADLARLCDLSAGYLSRAFRQTCGTPLFEYINRIRIQKACLLLKRSNMPVIEIAYAVGYNNLSFFNRYFRKLMRVSPSQYRNFAKK